MNMARSLQNKPLIREGVFSNHEDDGDQVPYLESAYWAVFQAPELTLIVSARRTSDSLKCQPSHVPVLFPLSTSRVYSTPLRLGLVYHYCTLKDPQAFVSSNQSSSH